MEILLLNRVVERIKGICRILSASSAKVLADQMVGVNDKFKSSICVSTVCQVLHKVF